MSFFTYFFSFLLQIEADFSDFVGDPGIIRPVLEASHCSNDLTHSSFQILIDWDKNNLVVSHRIINVALQTAHEIIL